MLLLAWYCTRGPGLERGGKKEFGLPIWADWFGLAQSKLSKHMRRLDPCILSPILVFG